MADVQNVACVLFWVEMLQWIKVKAMYSLIWDIIFLLSTMESVLGYAVFLWELERSY